ncbi:hypothetical protein NKH81_14290 [Mesorhizobium sp. M0959]|uniref:AMP-binding protein n=1 Tax=Mesorhizobium sp. M0959 TaxID=2957034 RepID=UPI00333D0710
MQSLNKRDSRRPRLMAAISLFNLTEIRGMGLIRRLEEHGDRPALIFPGRTPITYRDLARRVTALAAEFGPEKKLVAVAAEPTEHAVISYLAAMHGKHAVALIPPCDASALDDFVADFSPEIICRRVDARWRCRTEAGESNGALHPDLAMLLGTSGSTGKSRYVRLSAAAIEANAAAIVSYLELGHRDRAALIRLSCHSTILTASRS